MAKRGQVSVNIFQILPLGRALGFSSHLTTHLGWDKDQTASSKSSTSLRAALPFRLLHKCMVSQQAFAERFCSENLWRLQATWSLRPLQCGIWWPFGCSQRRPGFRKLFFHHTNHLARPGLAASWLLLGCAITHVNGDWFSIPQSLNGWPLCNFVKNVGVSWLWLVLFIAFSPLLLNKTLMFVCYMCCFRPVIVLCTNRTWRSVAWGNWGQWTHLQ